MAAQPKSWPLAAALGFIAALLAWSAAVVGYVHRHEVRWELIAGGLFCAALGLGALRRNGPAGK